MAKWVAQIDRVERIPEYVSRAFHTAVAGRPGPVVLALPEDTLFSDAAVADVPRHHVVRAAPAPADIEKLRRLLADAQRPFVLVGGGGWSAEACRGLKKWIESNGLPVGTSFRCQDLFDNRSANYVGDVGIGINPKLAERVTRADVLLVIGARLGEMTTSAYSLVDAPVPRQALVHVHGGAEELGRVYRPALAINSGMAQFFDAVSGLSFDKAEWRASTATARKEFLEWTEPRPMPGAVQYGEIIRWLSDHLPRTPSSRAARATSRAGCTGISATRLSHAARANERLNGLRLPGGGGGQACSVRSNRVRALRRRRLSDEWSGDRDRGAVLRELRRRGRE